MPRRVSAESPTAAQVAAARVLTLQVTSLPPLLPEQVTNILAAALADRTAQHMHLGEDLS